MSSKAKEKPQFEHERLAYVSINNITTDVQNRIHIAKIGQLPEANPNASSKQKKPRRDYHNRLYHTVEQATEVINMLSDDIKKELITKNHFIEDHNDSDSSEDMFKCCAREGCDIDPDEMSYKCCACDALFHRECYPIRLAQLIMFCSWACVQKTAQNMSRRMNEQKRVRTNPVPCSDPQCTKSNVVAYHHCANCFKFYHNGCLQDLEICYNDVIFFCTQKCLDVFTNKQEKRRMIWLEKESKKLDYMSNYPQKLETCARRGCELKDLPRTKLCSKCNKWLHPECAVKITYALESSMFLFFCDEDCHELFFEIKEKKIISKGKRLLQSKIDEAKKAEDKEHRSEITANQFALNPEFMYPAETKDDKRLYEGPASDGNKDMGFLKQYFAMTEDEETSKILILSEIKANAKQLLQDYDYTFQEAMDVACINDVHRFSRYKKGNRNIVYQKWIYS